MTVLHRVAAPEHALLYTNTSGLAMNRVSFKPLPHDVTRD